MFRGENSYFRACACVYVSVYEEGGAVLSSNGFFVFRAEISFFFSHGFYFFQVGLFRLFVLENFYCSICMRWLESPLTVTSSGVWHSVIVRQILDKTVEIWYRYCHEHT